MTGADIYFWGASGDHFPIPPQAKDGDITTFTVSCVATDDSGNKEATEFSFGVRDQRANPTFDWCPEYTRILLNDTLITTGTNFIAPTVQTLCEYNVTEAEGKDENTTLGLGVHLFSYTATDVHGNQGHCSFQVEVDFRDFVWINYPRQDFTLTKVTDPILGIYENVNWTEPSILNPYVEIVPPELPNGMAFPIGRTLVNYTAKFVPPDSSLIETSEIDWTSLLEMSEEMEVAVKRAQVELSTKTHAKHAHKQRHKAHTKAKHGHKHNHKLAHGHQKDAVMADRVAATPSPTQATYDFVDEDGTSKTVIISQLGMILQFAVEVKDEERPTFTGGFNTRRQCLDTETGVAEHEQCGGKRILYSPDPNDDFNLIYEGLEDVSLDCCGAEYTCTDFSPYVQTCQKITP
eukprot:CAMPEP_0197523732 /NCGR_PEP_ID=MMETSP1318-20131121/8607_1 /TAXON_ID=552666 /ORGANISM="Partenskyella glossopodia, Strain RCC365" /LENGTH=404 /DNA_ID=CAMNT_0043076521 /DNA_START=191 /DNA_END=1405 /DNA_ORIENTATION=+